MPSSEAIWGGVFTGLANAFRPNQGQYLVGQTGYTPLPQQSRFLNLTPAGWGVIILVFTVIIALIIYFSMRRRQ
jgi:hypothetical protein